MRALVFRGPGEMPLEDRPDPVAQAGWVVVAVRAAGICGSDVHGFSGSTGRRRVGVVMGHEAAGDVVEVGPDVASVRTGDRVALKSILSCGRCDRCLAGAPNLCRDRRGLGMHLDGAYADRVAVPEALVVPLPPELSYTQGALVEPLAVATHAVAMTPFDSRDTVVVIGAGAIGLLALVAARQRGARMIVVTDRDPHRLEVARTLGADLTIDVRDADPAVAIAEATGGRGADAVLEAVGISATVAQSVAVARPGGHVTWIGNSAPVVELPMQAVVTAEVTIRGAYGFVDEFETAAAALAEGRMDVGALVEHVAPFDDAPDLFARLAAGTLPAVKVILEPAAP